MSKHPTHPALSGSSLRPSASARQAPLHRGDLSHVDWIPSIKRGGAQRRGVFARRKTEP